MINVDFNHLKKKSFYFSQYCKYTVAARTAVIFVLFKVLNSFMHIMGKGQDCQILPERKSAIIKVWHGITYLTMQTVQG